MAKIIYRLAIDEDIKQIAEFHQDFFEQGRDEEKINWIWNANPAGRAIYVVALDGDKIVGTQCLIPYWLIDDSGERIMTGKSDDTCVHPRFRKKGVFRSMYKLIVDQARQNDIHFIWGFTSATAPFENIGFEIGDPYFMAIYGSTNSYYTLSMGKGLLKKIKTGAFLLGMMFRKTQKLVSVQEEKMKDILQEIVLLKQDLGLSIEMSQEYLTWRILQNPYYRKVYCLTYREGGQLVSYVVFHINGTTAYIIHDCCDHRQSPEMGARIMASFSKKMTNLGASVIKNWLFKGSYKAKNRLTTFKDAGYLTAKTGSHFVWLPLNKQFSLRGNDIYLTRIASLGTT